VSYIEQLLARNERIACIARDHWIALLPAILVDAAISIVIIGLSVLGIVLSPPWTWLGLLLLVVPATHLALRVWGWWNEQYVITNRRIIRVAGVLNKRVSDTALEKVNDILMEQSALGRALGFGNIEIISGSESGIDTFQRIVDPIGFKKELFDQKEALARMSGFEERAGPLLGAEVSTAGNIPELIVELDELRQRGVITDAEFEEKKQQLLGKL
jgi:hypothetical protein